MDAGAERRSQPRPVAAGLVVLLVAAGNVALPARAIAAEPPPVRTFSLREGTLAYKVIHRLHQVEGRTRSVEGRALVQGDGSAKVQVRAKVASFDSGNANRDAHMREATHEPVHSYASVKGTLEGLRLPITAPVDLAMSATVELNGAKQQAIIPISFRQEGPAIRATFSFPISLDSFKVERPELLFIKVDDRVQIAGDLSFEETP
jgi:polyisoprenoid-binding protein YceI